MTQLDVGVPRYGWTSRTRRVAAVVVPMAVALSACGTTVPLTQRAQSVVDGGTGGLQVAGGSTPGGVARGATVPDGGTLPGQTGASLAAGTTGGPVGRGTTGVGGTAITGRGVTATTVTVGVPVPTDGAAFASSLGISGAPTVSIQQAVDAVVADVNRSGGVLGRKLAVYYHQFDLATYVANPAQVVAAMCADFRDDHRVFAVLFDVPMRDLRECLAAMGTPLIGGTGGPGVVPASAYDEHGGNYFYAPQAITVERLAKLFIESLMQRDFHQHWDTTAGAAGGVAPVKLGVIHADSPEANALYAAYAKELAKYGLRFTDEVTYTANLQAGLAATQNAVLKFRADGITHVYGASAFFLQDAENQKYRPRYAYLPGLGALGAENVPAAQMRGAMTVGWDPTTDVEQEQDPGDTPGAAHCRAVMKRAGVKSSARADLAQEYELCDIVYVVRSSLAAGGAPTVPGFRRGYESLGTRFPTALTFRALLGPHRHYGVQTVRDMAWDTPCGCLRYTSRTDRS